MKHAMASLLTVNGLVCQFAMGAMADPVEGNRTLAVHPSFPSYFQNAQDQPLLLMGAYTWGMFSDADYDYIAMLDSLRAHGLNFARVWLWWGTEQFLPPDDNRHVEPFLRPGPGQANDGRPKYDLGRFNPVFFDRLEDFCAAARERGLFLQLVTMDAWMLKHPRLWARHAFHRDNNINGVDGDPRRTGSGTDGQQGFCSLGNARALEFQRAYLRRVVDTVNAFDNVLFEIANENFYSAAWETQLCEFIHQCEQDKPRRHLVMPKDLSNHGGVVQTWDARRVHTALMEQRRLRRPLIFDTDWTITQNDDAVRLAMWTAVLSGGHFNYMDESFQAGKEWHGDVRGCRRADLHRQIGYLAAFARQFHPWAMRPDDGLVQAGHAFAMASTNELAAYLPAGGNVTLDLSKLAGELEAHWFDPRAGNWGTKLTLPGGRSVTLAAPSGDDWALFCRRASTAKGPSPPARVQAAALTPSSVRVMWTAPTADMGAAGYKIFRNGAPVGTSILPSYTDLGLAPQQTCTYRVSAFDLSGTYSDLSTSSATVSTPSRALFCQVELGTEDKVERLSLATVADGDTRRAQAGGLDCREPVSTEDRYFYFTIDDGYLHNEAGAACRLEVTYFDDAGFIEPQYDSTGTAYAPATRVALTGTREWKTATWALTDCRFSNRQNAGADFRLFVGPNRVKVRRVRLLPEPVRE